MISTKTQWKVTKKILSFTIGLLYFQFQSCYTRSRFFIIFRVSRWFIYHREKEKWYNEESHSEELAEWERESLVCWRGGYKAFPSSILIILRPSIPYFFCFPLFYYYFSRQFISLIFAEDDRNVIIRITSTHIYYKLLKIFKHSKTFKYYLFIFL